MSTLLKLLAGIAVVLGFEEALAGVFQLLALAVTNIFWSPGMNPSLTLQTSADAVKPFHLLPGYPMFVCPLFFALRGALMGLARKIERDERAENERKRALAEAARAKEQASRDRLLAMNKRRAFLSHEIPSVNDAAAALVRAADQALTLAEQEFEGGYLDPFWDAVEDAATCLAKYQSNLHRLTSHIKELDAICSELGVSALARLPGDGSHANAAASRMRTIVRDAQRQATFSQIYHLRRTNRILVDGFSTLGHTLQTIDQSLSSAASEFAQANELFKQESADVRAHEEQVQTMLDNIQRHVRPPD